jgi:predicted GNAT superfamily acetyltransferase
MWSGVRSWHAFFCWDPEKEVAVGSSPSHPGDLVIRPFATLDEYEACAAFQEEIWGVGFTERVSAAILHVANRIGGLAAGAFGEDGVLHGFVFGLTGLEEGELVHWSDMLAVRSGLRDRGLGTRLKHYQREVLLARGVRRMRWTFDPLQSRNAFVNFAKLGITTGEYVRNMYGETGSPLHRGVGTDRLVALWEMDSDRVKERVSGEGAYPGPSDLSDLPAALSACTGMGHPGPGELVLDLGEPALTLAIPADIHEIIVDDTDLAVRWREATRDAFLHYFSRGYQATELVPTGRVSLYLLER